ncbi:GspH/FimT family pseudopilin [Hydrogenophaga sp.]|uniref:GspH/FimT family pseudopilin n=1 Tax=Hydrogenophaga sp. TaxID=1904254 RepID=UPI002730CF33|nr:GspH/FimT family pseudopilin [Hydrogenophaga sp.]MDP2073166.1 GspH/FimT family pseudopilin [Hydrogenophaga sp.]MDP3109105.1 GspH/FimT family pseudopilin [Hydrogenophaga sp.]MDP3348567.1 GspH/FimT family pseudopilin [Hydrogenophaga sp.]MDZ4398510.1 GspH/FimT family pseudopilin [Hydrogenophaga sp.]
MNCHPSIADVKTTPRKPPRQHASRGVTLVELIVCVSMLAVLVGLAVPSFSGLHSDWRRDSAIRDFMGDLQLARSTALRTSRTVVMCATLNGLACANGAISSDWRQGWIIFSDLDGDGALGNTEPVIVQRGPLIGLQQMQSNIAAGQLEFRSNGLLRRGHATVTVLSDGANVQRAMSIRINATGRAFLL